MNYYIDPNGTVYAYDDEQVAVGYPQLPMTPMTPEEVEAHIHPAPIPLTVEQVEVNRLNAYSNPVTGSDRWFSEGVRLTIMSAPQAEIDFVTNKGTLRHAEIQAENPWPVVEPE